MNRLRQGLAGFALLVAATLPAFAESSAASSASESVTTSVGSLSASVQRSSESSSKTTGVADGDYKIIEMAAVPERPGTVRMTLQAVADHAADGELFLYVPQQAVERSRLAAGQVVTAHQRAYGIEFAHGETKKAFFLVLTDDWYRELQTTPVVL